ncbi:hypothetical protein E2C01_020381 [Portunus trituberculatus]|uniref:Uncharacterized protein n=1 Tax=Portunus trituberculatus TaxID=210409 RepID=A0A5B7E1V4_PORTR|nr:hypothetical protein [Portunus trituberculatus]
MTCPRSASPYNTLAHHDTSPGRVRQKELSLLRTAFPKHWLGVTNHLPNHSINRACLRVVLLEYVAFAVTRETAIMGGNGAMISASERWLGLI